jgi:hypothetical protein
VPSFASVLQRSFSTVAKQAGIGPGVEEQNYQLLGACSRGLMEWPKAACLSSVYIGALHNQEPCGFEITVPRHTGMQRLIAYRIAGINMQMGAMFQQKRRYLRPAKGSGKMKGAPTVWRCLVNTRRRLGQ